jgi:hypothetical protein
MSSYEILRRRLKPKSHVVLTLIDSGRTIAGIAEEILDEGLVLITDSSEEFIPGNSITSWRIGISENSIEACSTPISSAAIKDAHTLLLKDETETGHAPDFAQVRVHGTTELLTVSLALPIDKVDGEQCEAEDVANNATSNPGVENDDEPINQSLKVIGINSYPTIPLPDFENRTENRGIGQNLNKWKNQYEYALKVKEPERMARTVSEIAEMAEVEGSGELYYLAGCLAVSSGLPIAKAEALFEKAASYGSMDACIARAALAAKSEVYTSASQWLVRAILLLDSAEASFNSPSLLGYLAACIAKIPNVTVPGLCDACEAFVGSPSETEALSLLARSLVRDASSAVTLVLNRDIDGARSLAPDAICFRSLRPLAKTTTNITPAPNETRKRFGKISTFKEDASFGFVMEDLTNVTWWFHRSNVVDPILARNLATGAIGQSIEFEGSPNILPGKNYPRIDRLRCLDAPKNEPQSGNIGKTARTNQEDKLRYLPKDRTTYQLAKRADLLKDFDVAEKLYQSAIEEGGPRCESAVKDFAMMLNQLDRSVEAIALLKKYRMKFGADRKLSFDRLSITIYQKMRDQQAVKDTLLGLLREERRPSQQRELERQIAAIEFQHFSKEAAIERLQRMAKNDPSDFKTARLFDVFRQSNEVGNSQTASPSEDESNRAVLSVVFGISQLATGMIESCLMRGVDERSKESGNFSDKDFKAVRTLLEQIKGRRPQERADYYLTLAKLCQVADEGTNEDNTRAYLRRYFLDSGEAAMSNNLHADTQRCYLIESLSLFDQSDHGRGDVASTAFALLIGTYVYPAIDPSELLAGHRQEDRLKRPTLKLSPDSDGWKKFKADFCYYQVMATDACNWFIEQISKISPDHALSANKNESTREIDKLNSCIRSASICFQNSLTAEALQRGRDSLRSSIDSARFVLDAERMRQAAMVFDDASAYCLETNFRNQETKCLRLESDISRLIDEINRAPTKLSYEHLVLPLEGLKGAISRDFESRSTRAPTFEVKNVLDNDYYSTDSDGSVSVRLEIKSLDAASPPVESIDIVISGCSAEPCHSPAVLYGGESREIAVLVTPTREQIESGAFSIDVSLRFRNRSGNIDQSSNFPLAIRIGDTDSFTEIPNPYSRYAGGSPVDDDKMFYGRKTLVSRIVEHCTSGSLGQCFVLYGQKRSGKSSVIRQVHHALPTSCLGVRMSVGDLDLSKLWPSFGRTLVRELAYSLEDRNTSIPPDWPIPDQAEANPLEAIRSALRGLKRLQLRPVITVDEFTYIYEQPRDVALQFMRGWKGLLEQQLFSSVLVGQDTMPRFKIAFANEFGVTHDERISYLKKDEAFELAENPILLEGASRYRGKALESLFHLTAGSPFFEQIFCDALVLHLNSRRASFITEADVSAVARELVSGGSQVPAERFDSLVSAASTEDDIAKQPIRRRILSLIAKYSNQEGWAAKSSLPNDAASIEVLNDLKDRAVISLETDAYRISVGLFSDWLKANYVE